MSKIHFSIPVPEGDFALDLFAATGLNCINLVSFGVEGDLPVSGGGGISFADVNYFTPWSSWERELNSTNPSASITGACCWSNALSGGETITGVNSSGAPRILTGYILGLIDDCAGSSSSSAPPPCGSSSSP